MIADAPPRPLLRWLGGKYRLAPWIVSHMPEHRIYVEPFGGAASVLLAKPRSHNEVLNDLDGDLVNLYGVLRDPDQSRQLLRRLRLTPYHEGEYRLALQPSDEPVERAARLIIRSYMAHGSNAARADRPTGFRCDGRSGGTDVAGEWATYPRALVKIMQRVRGVSIRQMAALDLVERFRDPKVLIYLDPPYVPETRSTKQKGGKGFHAYRHEMSEDDHRALLTALADHPAMIMLSGYESDLYAKALRGWTVERRADRAHRSSPRIELLWINPAAHRAHSHGPLFGPQPRPREEQTATLPQQPCALHMADRDDSAGSAGPVPSESPDAMPIDPSNAERAI